MSVEVIFGKFGSNIAEIRRRAVDGFFLKLRCGIISILDLVPTTAKARSTVDSLLQFLLAEYHEPEPAADAIGKIINLLHELTQLSPEVKSTFSGRPDICDVTKFLLKFRDLPGCPIESVHALLSLLPEPTASAKETSKADSVNDATQNAMNDVSETIKNSFNISNASQVIVGLSNAASTCICLQSSNTQVPKVGPRKLPIDRNLDDIKTIDEAVRSLLVATSQANEANQEQLIRSLFSIRHLMLAEVPIDDLVVHPRFSAVMFSLLLSDHGSPRFTAEHFSLNAETFEPVTNTTIDYLTKLIQSTKIDPLALFIDTFLEGCELLTDLIHQCLLPKASSYSHLRSVATLLLAVCRLLSKGLLENKEMRQSLFALDNQLLLCCKSPDCRRSRLLGICSSLADAAAQLSIAHCLDIKTKATSEKYPLAVQCYVSIQRCLVSLAVNNCLPIHREKHSSKGANSLHSKMSAIARQLRLYVLCPSSVGHESLLEDNWIESCLIWIEKSGCDASARLGTGGGNSQDFTTIRSEIALCHQSAISARKALELRQLLTDSGDPDLITQLIEESLQSLPSIVGENVDDELVKAIVKYLMEKLIDDSKAIGCFKKLLETASICPAIVSCLLDKLIFHNDSQDLALSLLRQNDVCYYLINVLGRQTSSPAPLVSFLTKLLASNALTSKTRQVFDNCYASLPIFLVPLFASSFQQQEHADSLFSSLVASFLSTSSTICGESDSICLAFLSACSRIQKAPALRRDGLRKLQRLVPGLTSCLTYETWANLLISLQQSPARCTQLMLNGQPAQSTKIDSLIQAMAQICSTNSGDLTTTLNEISIILHNPANHDRFLTIGGFDLLMSFLLNISNQGSIEANIVSLRARVHLLTALKWLILARADLRHQLHANSKGLKVIVLSLNDHVTAGSAAALLSILATHRLTALIEPSSSKTPLFFTLPAFFEQDFELPLDYVVCPSTISRNTACSGPVKPLSSTSPQSQWARFYFFQNSPIDLWTGYRIYDGALQWHLHLCKQSSSHEKYVAALQGFSLALQSQSIPNPGNSQCLFDCVSSALGMLLGSNSPVNKTNQLSAEDCRCLAVASRLSWLNLRLVGSVDESFIQVQLPRLVRFGVEALASLMSGSSSEQSSEAALNLVDFLLGAIRYLLLNLPQNNNSQRMSLQAFAADSLGTLSEIILVRKAEESINSSLSAALVSLLASRFVDATRSCRPFLDLLPASKLFSQLMNQDASAPSSLASPLALAQALLPRRIFALKAAAIASSKDCAIVSLATCESLDKTFESFIDSFVLNQNDPQAQVLGLMAASRLVQLSLRSPNANLMTTLVIKRYLLGENQPLSVKTSAVCLLSACLGVWNRRDFNPKEESVNFFDLTSSDVEELVRQAKTFCKSSPGTWSERVVFASALASLTSTHLPQITGPLNDNWVESLLTSLVDCLPQADVEFNSELDHTAHCFGTWFLPCLTQLSSNLRSWPSGIVASLRNVCILAKRLLTQTRLSLSAALCRFICQLLATDLTFQNVSDHLPTSLMMLLTDAADLVPFEAIAWLLDHPKASPSDKQLAALTLLGLCQVAVTRCDPGTRRRFVEACPQEYFHSVEKLEELSLIGLALPQHRHVVVTCVKSCTALLSILQDTQLACGLFESNRIWQRIVELAKRIQNSALEPSGNDETLAFEELASLLDLLCIAAAFETKQESPSFASGILPVIATTLLTFANPHSYPGGASTNPKTRALACPAAISCLKLARNLLGSWEKNGYQQAVVPVNDVLSISELLARTFMIDLMQGNQKGSKMAEVHRLLASVAIDLLVATAVSSPRGLGRIFCQSRLPQRLAQRLLTLIPSATSSKLKTTASLENLLRGQEVPKTKAVTERSALLRLLKAAALLWPAGHHVVLSDASQLYMPLLNDWAGLERDQAAAQILQLLAKRAKTARRLGLQQKLPQSQQSPGSFSALSFGNLSSIGGNSNKSSPLAINRQTRLSSPIPVSSSYTPN